MTKVRILVVVEVNVKDIVYKYHFVFSYFVLSILLSTILWLLVIKVDQSFVIDKHSVTSYYIEVVSALFPGLFLGSRIDTYKQLVINCILIYAVNFILSFLITELPSYGRTLDNFKYFLFFMSLPFGFILKKLYFIYRGKK